MLYKSPCMPRSTVALCVFALAALAGELRAAPLVPELCVPDRVSLLSLYPGEPATPAVPGEAGEADEAGEKRYVVFVLAENADCAPLELLPNVDCEAPQKTPWRAGILGLCDAPYGLGILGPIGRSLRVVRVHAAPSGAPLRPHPLPHAEAEVDSASTTPASMPDRLLLRDALALVQADADASGIFAVGEKSNLVERSGQAQPGHERRVDRPPRI